MGTFQTTTVYSPSSFSLSSSERTSPWRTAKRKLAARAAPGTEPWNTLDQHF